MTDLSKETTASFNARISANVSASMLSAGISVGNRLQLFDILLDSEVPLTSGQIADIGNFKERYVREWLSLMAVGRIVDFANEVTGDNTNLRQTFTIPEHRRSVLHSKKKGPDGAVFQDMVPLMLGVNEDLLQCFRKEGPQGISYDRYPEFQEWRNRLNSKRNTAEDVYKSLVGIDGMIAKLETGIKVLELGCSTGNTTFAMAKQFPQSKFHGFDISEEAIATANRVVADSSLSNLTFSVDDACAMPPAWRSSYDLVLAWDVIHDVPRADLALAEITRVMKPDGVVSIMEVRMHSDPRLNLANEMGTFYYGASLFHCVPVSLNFEGGMGLGVTWGRELACKMFREAGFEDIIVKDYVKERHYMYVLRLSNDKAA